jgi:hypothetical protein
VFTCVKIEYDSAEKTVNGHKTRLQLLSLTTKCMIAFLSSSSASWSQINANDIRLMLLVAFCIKYDVEPTVEKAHPFVTLHQKTACKFPCIQSIWTIFIYMHMPWISTPTWARTDTFFLIKVVKTYDISLLKNTASHPPTFIQSSTMRLCYHLSGLSRVQSV